MAVFPQLITEAKVQVDDKTRLDANGTFVTQDEDAISLLRIKPSASDSYIDVTTKKYLDWAYATGGIKTATVEVTTGTVVAGLPEISTIQTIADSVGQAFVVWDVLTAGATDDGSGGISGGGSGVADLSKSDANGKLSGVDFVLTYEMDGLSVPSDFFLGVSSNNTVDDFGTFTGMIFTSGGGSATLVFEDANAGSGSITLSANNIIEFARTGSNFTMKIDAVTVFTTGAASAIAAYPMVRLKGASGVLTSSYNPAAGAGLNDTYFLYNTPANDYAFYIDVGGGGSAPSVASVEVAVAITAGDVANDVAIALQAAMDGVTGITASVLADLVTANNDAEGNVTDASDNDTGFTVLTTQQGTAGTGAVTTKDFTIEAISVIDDCLFSNDSMLVALEGEVLKYVRKGRNTFLDKHREAQESIIEYLDEAKIWKKNVVDDMDQYADCVPMPYTKADICALTGDDFDQFQRWSKFMVMEMIFCDLSKQVDDIFNQKAKKYGEMMDTAKNRGALRLDKDGDGVIELEDFNDLSSGTLERS